ncbi:hypothetical protein [Pontivivens ytuae]|uniref:Uncharacterized protein n=1 Tax=Pontivivens ytuae TaxID=2789856 RepID=A0A7S9LNJ8_9RHOB|nr:hypothetical protein [Pontivivens ytuae]QPH52379.1 hypothetical protein I0K15_11130 [Pontivivens ytuae]
MIVLHIAFAIGLALATWLIRGRRRDAAPASVNGQFMEVVTWGLVVLLLAEPATKAAQVLVTDGGAFAAFVGLEFMFVLKLAMLLFSPVTLLVFLATGYGLWRLMDRVMTGQITAALRGAVPIAAASIAMEGAGAALSDSRIPLAPPWGIAIACLATGMLSLYWWRQQRQLENAAPAHTTERPREAP